MPRSIDVILRGGVVDLSKPGDKAIFTGKLVVVPDVRHVALVMYFVY
jgi:DNA replication licensing factor MCM6